MSTGIACLEDKALRINAAHERVLIAATEAVDASIEVGRLLTEAKAEVPHGGWIEWVNANCVFGDRQASKYLRCWRERDAITEALRTAGNPAVGIDRALALLAAPKPEPTTSVVEIGISDSDLGISGPFGKTIVNGVEQEDEAVAMARAAGRISEGVAVVVEDIGDDETDVESIREERAAIDEETDDEWLAALPLWPKLSGVSRALLWRRMETARRSYAHHARIAFKEAERGRARSTVGGYEYWLRFHLNLEDPSRWRICPPTEDGGCGGTGQNAVSQCPTCHGCGYLNRFRRES